MMREPQKRTTDEYRRSWDEIFGKNKHEKEQTPVDNETQDQYNDMS